MEKQDKLSKINNDLEKEFKGTKIWTILEDIVTKVYTNNSVEESYPNDYNPFYAFVQGKIVEEITYRLAMATIRYKINTYKEVE